MGENETYEMAVALEAVKDLRAGDAWGQVLTVEGLASRMEDESLVPQTPEYWEKSAYAACDELERRGEVRAFLNIYPFSSTTSPDLWRHLYAVMPERLHL